jgi:hypothetical protein
MGENSGHFHGEVGASLKLEIKTEIPSESSGKLIDAIVDIFRPLSEGLGYVGDKIHLRRQKTLQEISRIAKDRIDSIGKQTNAIPDKFFIPLLEKASLEDLNDTTLVSMWANLITTAATEKVPMLAQYVSILSQISGEQVAILEKMFNNSENVRAHPYPGAARAGHLVNVLAGHLIGNYHYLNQTGLPGMIDNFDCSTADQLGDKLTDSLDIKGVAIDTINVFYLDSAVPDGGFSISSPDGIYSDSNYYNFENLVRLGLVDRVEIRQHRIGKFDIDVYYYIVSPVGIDLYACCNPEKLRREE